jgi:hypothetical protein
VCAYRLVACTILKLGSQRYIYPGWDVFSVSVVVTGKHQCKLSWIDKTQIWFESLQQLRYFWLWHLQSPQSDGLLSSRPLGLLPMQPPLSSSMSTRIWLLLPPVTQMWGLLRRQLPARASLLPHSESDVDTLFTRIMIVRTSFRESSAVNLPQESS